MYLALLMVDGYEETDWPMQYTQSVAIAWAWFEWLFGDLHIYKGTSDILRLFCPNEQ